MTRRARALAVVAALIAGCIEVPEVDDGPADAVARRDAAGGANGGNSGGGRSGGPGGVGGAGAGGGGAGDGGRGAGVGGAGAGGGGAGGGAGDGGGGAGAGGGGAGDGGGGAGDGGIGAGDGAGGVAGGDGAAGGAPCGDGALPLAAGPEALVPAPEDILERRMVEYVDFRGDTRIVSVVRVRTDDGSALRLQAFGGPPIELRDDNGFRPILAAAQGRAYVAWTQPTDPGAFPHIFVAVADLDVGQVIERTPLGEGFGELGDVVISADAHGAVVSWGAFAVFDGPPMGSIRVALVDRNGTRVLDPVEIPQGLDDHFLTSASGLSDATTAWIFWVAFEDEDNVWRRRVDRMSGEVGEPELVVRAVAGYVAHVASAGSDVLVVYGRLEDGELYWSVVAPDGEVTEHGPIQAPAAPHGPYFTQGATPVPVSGGDAPRIVVAAMGDTGEHLIALGTRTADGWEFEAHAAPPIPPPAPGYPVAAFAATPSQRETAESELARLTWHPRDAPERTARFACPRGAVGPCTFSTLPDPLDPLRTERREQVSLVVTSGALSTGWADFGPPEPGVPPRTLGFTLAAVDARLTVARGGGPAGVFARTARLGTTERFLGLGTLGDSPWAVFEASDLEGRRLVAAPLGRVGIGLGRGSPLTAALPLGEPLRAVVSQGAGALAVLWAVPGSPAWQVVTLAAPDAEPSPLTLDPAPEVPATVRSWAEGVEVLDIGPSGVRVLRYGRDGRADGEPATVPPIDGVAARVERVAWDGVHYGVLTSNRLSPEIRRFYVVSPAGGDAPRLAENDTPVGELGGLSPIEGGGFLLSFRIDENVQVVRVNEAARATDEWTLAGPTTAPHAALTAEGIYLLETDTGLDPPRAWRYGCR